MQRQAGQNTAQPGALAGDRCTCQNGKAVSLVRASQNGCVKCCLEYINEAGKVVNGTTALIEAAKNGHVDVMRLLASSERYLTDDEGKSIWYHAATHGRETLDELLKATEPEFFTVIREMRGGRCICVQPASNATKYLKKHCANCCASNIHEISEFLEDLIVETKTVQERSLVPVKMMIFLQKKLRAGIGCPELTQAVWNNLYDAVALLVNGQRALKDKSNRKASDYAVSVHNPRLWAMFPEDITQEYAADLEAAHAAECVCNGNSSRLNSAIRAKCLRCCARFVWEASPYLPYNTHLEYAVESRNLSILKLLMHKQAGIRSSSGDTTLMRAVQRNNLPAVKLLADKEAKLQNQNGTTALILASSLGHVQMVQHLIPFEVRMRDNLGRTALVHAILKNRFEAAKVLLPHERDTIDNEGRRSEDYAFRGDDLRFWRLFHPNITQEEGLQRYRKTQSACTCQQISSALIEAAGYGCIDCCKRFIGEAGIKVNQDTALMKAAEQGHAEVVKLLMKAEAGMQDLLKNTALIKAARKGNLEAVKLLIPHEAGVTTRTNTTALAEAVRYFRKDCVDVLLQSPDEIQASKVTRAMLAAYDGDLQTVLQNRSEWGSVFDKGLTVLDFAFLNGRRNLVPAITKDWEARQRLTCGAIAWPSNGTNILVMAEHFEIKQRHLKQMLDVVCTADLGKRSALAALGLFDYCDDEPGALWRPFCSPQMDDLRRVLCGYLNGEKAIRGFRALKNAGVAYDVRRLQTKDMRVRDGVLKYVAQNPLKSKQLELAQKQYQATIPDGSRFAWRETESEAVFNRSLLLECRKLWWETPQAPKSHPIPPIVTYRAGKLEDNAALIRAAYHYFYRKVREMLDE